jgi:hypothetical protein
VSRYVSAFLSPLNQTILRLDKPDVRESVFIDVVTDGSQDVLVVGLQHALEELLHRFSPLYNHTLPSQFAYHLLQVSVTEDLGLGNKIEAIPRADQCSSLKQHAPFDLQHAKVAQSLLLCQTAYGLERPFVVQALGCR